MNHDNLRLNSTHNPENSHIFLDENKRSAVRIQKNSAPRRAQRDDGVTYKYDEVSDAFLLDINKRKFVSYLSKI